MKKIIVTRNKVFKKQLGQSMIEMVFAITVVALVITGAVVLIVNSIGVKNRSFDRKKAMEIAEIVMESLVDQKKNDSDYFWQQNQKVGETLANFSGYSYDIGYSGIDCDSGTCALVTVIVNWADDKTLQVNKFFSKEVD